jgi:hypothetical protein
MTPSELLGAFITGVLTVAIISLIVAPQSKAGETVKAFGDSFSGVLGAAKSYPK